MKPVRRLLTLAAVGALGAATWGVGTSLVKDVRFASAQEAVSDARKSLETGSDMSGLYKQVNHVMENSVVHLTVSKTVTAQSEENPLRRFFGPDGTPRRFPDRLPQTPEEEPDDTPQPGEREVATGSGVIMDASDGWAWIVTNNHVVSDASNVKVTLNDGRVIQNATVVATDPKSDLAVVKFKADRIITAKWGESDKLEKGDIVVAFGSPFGFVGSMSHGIISALNRDQVRVNENASGFAYENFIQVDAAINPGNSGGPLCDTRGNVIGINTAIASRSGSFSGIGFAIPSNQAKQVYESLKSSGKVVRGYLGVQIADIHADDPTGQIKEDVESTGFKGDTGTLVRGVMANSPALNVLKLNDIITELNGQPLKSMTSFRTQIAAMPPGAAAKLKVWRVDPTKGNDEASKGSYKEVEIKLGTQPDGEIALGGGSEKPAPGKSLQLNQFGLTVTTPTADDLTAAGLPGEAQGALVKQVRPGSAAQRIGLAAGDLITRIGPSKVANADDARDALAKADLAKGLRIDVLNKQGERMLRVPGRAR